MNKLSDTLNIDLPDELKDDSFKIEIPESATLEDITRLALEAFKHQMEATQFIEPKYRARNLEVCQSYLALAKDAIAKKTDQEMKQADKAPETNDKEDGEFSRQQILKEINEQRKLKVVK